MKKRTWLVAALLGSYALQGVAQVLPTDVAGDKLYQQVCQEYALKNEQRIELLQNYLDQYPDSRHTNRVETLIAAAYFEDENYEAAIALYRSCKLEDLATEERDRSLFQLATSYLKVGDLRESAVWFTLLRDVSEAYQVDARYHLAYLAYAEKRYDEALREFVALQNNPKYGSLVPYYLGEIYLVKGDCQKAREVAENYLNHYATDVYKVEMHRIWGESLFGLQKYGDAIAPLAYYQANADAPLRKALYALGMSYYYTGIYSKSADVLGAATSVRDGLAQNAYLHMGLSYLSLKERNQARMAFEQAASLEYDQQVKEQALYNYALSIHETSYSPFDESVTVFERFLNEFPSSTYVEKVNDYLVEVYMNTRSYEAAIQSIAKIQSPGSRILEAKQKVLFRLGTQAFANAAFPEAINCFTKSLELGRYNQETKAEAYYWRGEAKYRLDRFADAGADYRQYLEFTNRKSSAEYGLALYNLGYTEFKQKKYAAALRWFTQLTSRGTANARNVQADAYNRMGDCHFHARSFDQARQEYAKASNLDPSLADYSTYQEAFVRGLQRDYRGKIQLLNSLIANYPNSQYMPDALYEQGRAFIQLEEPDNAIERFRVLANKFPESAVARRAANEIGLLYYQNDKYQAAIEAYKYVISRYPGSEEARVAQRDLKSIYIDLNQVDSYANFASSLPGGANFDVSERDSLTYVAAERVYMRGSNNEEARASFNRYLQSFPQGAFSLDAHYYLGLMEFQKGATEQATMHFDKVLQYPNNKYSEGAMGMGAEMHFKAERFDQALAVYKQLNEKASTPERKEQAKVGMLRSAQALGDNEEVIWAAGSLLSDAKTAPEIANEAHYYRAKAYLATGNLAGAFDEWSVLAKDTRNVYGAEAKFRVAERYYSEGKNDLAEKEVLNYIEVSTPHTYWLARSFVLLADVYTAVDRKLDAKQYLLSLQQNYQAQDDIAGMIESRLNQLNP
ncbi:MAG: tetratricopeptide repeat protein [Phocaeicola sp.]